MRLIGRAVALGLGIALALQVAKQVQKVYIRPECPHCGNPVGVFFPADGMEVFCDSCNQPMALSGAPGTSWKAEAVS